MKELRKLFENNKRWVKQMTHEDPKFFQKLVRQHAPEYLWIGCSDSRVPANEIVGLLPGELFVHRNVGNLVVHTDMNCMSVLQYAVEVLKVKHVIVCGHYNCGGVTAAMEDRRHGLIDQWIRNIQDVYRKHEAQLDGIEDRAARLNRLCELNVVEQVLKLGHTTMVHDAWARGRQLTVHGWIYGISNGLLRDMKVCLSGEKDIRKLTRAAGRKR